LITKGGKAYPTIQDAALELGVSPKTVRNWIRNGIIAPPPQIEYGVRIMDVYPAVYIKRAKAAVVRHRKKREKLKI